MTQEVEKLKAELVAAQCRIDELENGYKELAKKCRKRIFFNADTGKGFNLAVEIFSAEIKSITGK